MVKLLKKEGKLCTGCSACFNICPTEAIQMKRDIYGFERAIIQKDKCVNCHNCEKVCPVLHVDSPNNAIPKSYAIWANDDIRKCSSAGGAFSLIAQAVLQKGGIVYGAAFKNVTEVHHKSAVNTEELISLQKSKYVQSHIGTIYKEIENNLKNKCEVLFSGCPCQVAGLKAYLQKDYDNLYTIDLVCTGVLSSQMLQESLTDVGGCENIECIDFRNKDIGWDCSNLTIYTKDKRKRILPIYEVPWERQSQFEVAMHKHLAQNDACEKCIFCAFPRQGDITLGDYWGVWEKDKTWNDHKGTSMLLVNNMKGEGLLKEIKSQIKRIEEVPWQKYAKNRLQMETSFNVNRKRFLTLYPVKPFDEAVKASMSGWHDIGLVGNWNGRNYGSELTHYALYWVLNSWKYSVLMIGVPQYAEWSDTNDLLFRKNPYPTWDIAPVAQKEQDMIALNQQCEKFILGADQLLDGYLFEKLGEFSSLEWVSDAKVKITYATSFGYDELRGNENTLARMGHGIVKLDAISVRETSGVKIMRESFGRDAVCVLEPVFLPPTDFYNDIQKNSNITKKHKPYLLVYSLDPTEQQSKCAHVIANQYGWEIVLIEDAAHKSGNAGRLIGCQAEENISVEDWLWYIQNSEMVLTDSFHATCFAIIYHKNFLSICNYGRGATRFYSLLEKLGLINHLIADNTSLPNMENIFEIDYEKVDDKLEKWRKYSLEWLESAINSVKKKEKVQSSYFLLKENLLRNEQELSYLKKEIERLNRLNEKSKIKWLKRKFVGGIKCLQDNGIKYTINHLIQKIKFVQSRKK